MYLKVAGIRTGDRVRGAAKAQERQDFIERVLQAKLDAPEKPG
jgi:hypothetical protein